ncbi:hypothetical protein D3C84_1150810 [compost metagenome]
MTMGPQPTPVNHAMYTTLMMVPLALSPPTAVAPVMTQGHKGEVPTPSRTQANIIQPNCEVSETMATEANVIITPNSMTFR